MEIEQLYRLYQKSGTVTTDSRYTPDGSLFFALKGENFDGNNYIDGALASGCRYAVTERESMADGERIFYFPDALVALQQLANFHRRVLNLPVIAITGTNGKTTTKELTAAVLGRKYNVLATEGNLNNHIGVPLTLLKMRPKHQMAIVEMGASKRGDIEELTLIAEPNFGLITNIGKAHLEGFGSFEGVMQTKKELYDYIHLHKGTLFVNGADSLLMSLSGNTPKKIYGDAPNTHATATVDEGSFLLHLRLTAGEESAMVATQLVGSYNRTNLLAATAVGLAFEVPFTAVAEALMLYKPENMRSQYKETNRNKLIIDTYNANPTSMEAAIRNFAALTGKNKWMILGDMKELGVESTAEHGKIVALIKELGFEKALLCGPEFGKIDTSPYLHFSTTEALAGYLETTSPSGAVVLVKGSRSMRLEQIINRL